MLREEDRVGARMDRRDVRAARAVRPDCERGEARASDDADRADVAARDVELRQCAATIKGGGGLAVPGNAKDPCKVAPRAVETRVERGALVVEALERRSERAARRARAEVLADGLGGRRGRGERRRAVRAEGDRGEGAGGGRGGALGRPAQRGARRLRVHGGRIRDEKIAPIGWQRRVVMAPLGFRRGLAACIVGEGWGRRVRRRVPRTPARRARAARARAPHPLDGLLLRALVPRSLAIMLLPCIGARPRRRRLAEREELADDASGGGAEDEASPGEVEGAVRGNSALARSVRGRVDRLEEVGKRAQGGGGQRWKRNGQ
jgi:hypothetical protein